MLHHKTPAMNVFRRIYNFYYEGFRDMTVGKTLWLLIFVKLFVMFVILKLFFFQSQLGKYETQQEKSGAVIENLLK